MELHQRLDASPSPNDDGCEWTMSRLETPKVKGKEGNE